jgi:hypothetical protein
MGQPHLCTQEHVYAATLCIVGGPMQGVGPTAAYDSHKVNLFERVLVLQRHFCLEIWLVVSPLAPE